MNISTEMEMLHSPMDISPEYRPAFSPDISPEISLSPPEPMEISAPPLPLWSKKERDRFWSIISPGEKWDYTSQQDIYFGRAPSPKKPSPKRKTPSEIRLDLKFSPEIVFKAPKTPEKPKEHKPVRPVPRVEPVALARPKAPSVKAPEPPLPKQELQAVSDVPRPTVPFVKKTAEKPARPKKALRPKTETDFTKFLSDKGVVPTAAMVIDMIEQGGNPGQILSRESTVCSLIDSGELKFGYRPLGEGSYGKVFELFFPNMRGRYVVKESKVPELPQPCRTSQYDIRKSDGRGYISIPRGSFICSEPVSEFVISLLVANILRRNISMNFIDTFYFGICSPRGRDKRQYTFMEQIDGDLEHHIRRMTREQVNAAYVQIIHAIATYQRIYGIVHGDLHEGNVFIDASAPPTDFFEYVIDGTRLYVPSRNGIVVKIGDWGMSVKYGTPTSKLIVGNAGTLFSAFANPAAKAVMPNFYNRNYDMCWITARLYILDRQNPFLNSIMRWMLAGAPVDEAFDTKLNYRPKCIALTTTLAHVTPEALLLNSELMGAYLVARPRGSIKLMGTI